jgi:hypothetical protein
VAPTLTATQHSDLVLLLGKALWPDALVWMVESALGPAARKDLGDTIGDRPALAARVVELLEAAGKTQEAIAQLLTVGRPNREVVYGLKMIQRNERLDQKALQAFTNEYEPFMSTAGVGDLMLRLRHIVCAIGLDLPKPYGGLKGTGFLIGRDLVLTNYHVIRDVLTLRGGKVAEAAGGDKIHCYFDYLWEPAPTVPPNGAPHHSVAVTAVKEKWLVHARPLLEGDGTSKCQPPQNNELDYAVFRITQPLGERPIRKSGGAVRGWIPLEHIANPLPANARLIVFQHPQGVAQQFDIGEFSRPAVNMQRLWYSVSAAKGSSGGATVCVEDGKLLALHNAEVENPPALPNEKLNQGVPIDLIANDLLKSVQNWVTPLAAAAQDLGHWSLSDDLDNPLPVIGRIKARRDMLEMSREGGKRAMIVRGPAGSGVRFSTRLLRRVLGAQVPIVVFKPDELGSHEPPAFLRVLADQLSLPALADHPIPAPKATENTSRWLRNDLPDWLSGRLAEDAKRRPSSYPAWIVIDAMSPGQRLHWAANLKDLLAALVGVRDPEDTAPDITQLRWLFLTDDLYPVPLTGVDVVEEDLTSYPVAVYREEFSECMRLAWQCAKPDAIPDELAWKSLAMSWINMDGGRTAARKALAFLVQQMLANARSVGGGP